MFRFSPGILETYKHDHSLVKIGVSMATLKQLLDVGTKVLSNIADYSRQLLNSPGMRYSEMKTHPIAMLLPAIKLF